MANENVVFKTSTSRTIDDLLNWNKTTGEISAKTDIAPITPGTIYFTSDGHILYDLDTNTRLWMGKNAYSAIYAEDINNAIDNNVDTSTVYYGTCATGASTRAKVVDCSGFVLTTGATIIIKMTNAQTYNASSSNNVTLNVNNTGAINLKTYGTTQAPRYCWVAGEVINVVYDGTNYILLDNGLATTTYYGVTKLASSTISTSTSTALTPASLYNFITNYLNDAPTYSTSTAYNVGDIVRYTYGVYICNIDMSAGEAWNAEHWTLMPTLQSQIDLKAPLESPNFTGIPTAPTAATNTNTTQIATTAFVTTAISGLIGPMSFKGSLGTNGTITTLPAASASNKGYTYKVITDNTYQTGENAKIGDLYISDGSNWILIPSGDEPSGTVTSITAGTGLTATNNNPITSSGTLSLNIAGNNTLGGIKLGYTETDKNYAIQIDENGKAFVTVPWTDNNTTSFTITANATDGLWDLTGTNGTNAVTYALSPYTSKQTTTTFYTGTTSPTLTTRLNYDGYLYATKLYSNGKEVLTDHQSVVNDNINLNRNTETTIATIGGTPIKIKLPASDNTDTHRPVQINGTEILGNNTTVLNLKAGSNISLSNNSGTVTITATDTTYTFDGTYNASTNKAATVSTVTNAIAALDSSLPTGSAASKTLTGLTITDGKMTAATFSDIAISASQITSGTFNNDKLTNSSITINNASVSLGGSLSLADIGLSTALRFKGVTTTTMSDGRTVAAITINNTSYNPSQGDVVIYSDEEYLWTGETWERLGRDSSFKLTQTAFIDSTGTSEDSTATRFIYSISQDANGVVSVKTRPLPTYNNYSLPIASSSTLGGIKIGSGLTINSTSGILSIDGLNTSTGSTTKALSQKGTWIDVTNNTGTVTSVAASGSNGISISGSPITTSGTITVGLNLSTAINGLEEGTSPANRNDYIVAQYSGGGTTNTNYYRRKLSNIFAALSASDITTALGFTPYNSTNPNGYTSNTGTVTSITLKAGTGISLDTDNTAITTSGIRTISLKTAGDSQLGGIKTNYTTNNKKYAIKVDNEGNAYVDVPWENTQRPLGSGANDAAAGNHTHQISLATDTGTNDITLAYGSKYKLIAGGSSVIFTMPNTSGTWSGNATTASKVNHTLTIGSYSFDGSEDVTIPVYDGTYS